MGMGILVHPGRRVETAALAALLAAGLSAQPAPPPPGATPGGIDSEAQMKALMKSVLLEKVPPPTVALPPPPADLRRLDGTWIADQLTLLRYTKDMNGQPVPLNAEGRRILDRRVKAAYVEHSPYANAAAYCQPPGAAWQLGLLYPFQIYQTDGAMMFVFSEYHTVWGVRMNAAHRAAGARDYMGDPVGHWEGDTLVIDTTRHKAPLWIDADGSPASADAHIVFRIRRVGGGGRELEIVTTIDDPKYYSAPWSYVHTYAWRPDMEFFYEYDCERQLDGPDAIKRYALRPEPRE